MYAIHLNDNSLLCVFTSLDVICSPNSRFITDMNMGKEVQIHLETQYGCSLFYIIIFVFV